MLVLTRLIGQKIHIGDSITITVTGKRAGQMRIGIEAPQSLSIRRGELPLKPGRRNKKNPPDTKAA